MRSEWDDDPLVILNSVVFVGKVDRVCSGDLVPQFFQRRSRRPSRGSLWEKSKHSISIDSPAQVGAFLRDSPGAKSPFEHTGGYRVAIPLRASGIELR
jgi:hypothetical protein